MTDCKVICDHIEKLAPKYLAEDWDNVGLLVGDYNKEIKRVLLALDMDEFVANEAVQKNAGMVITHHPIMFSPINSVTEHDVMQKTIRMLVKGDICHYAAHTNLDVAPGGLNDLMAEKMGLLNTKVLEVTRDSKYGPGRYADLENAVNLEHMIQKCKKVFDIQVVKYVGKLDNKIKRVAVNTGGGSDAIEKCYENNVDLFITGDIKYSIARAAYERGLCIIDAGHFDTEIMVKDLLFDYLSKQFPYIEFIKSESNINVVKTYL